MEQQYGKQERETHTEFSFHWCTERKTICYPAARKKLKTVGKTSSHFPLEKQKDKAMWTIKVGKCIWMLAHLLEINIFPPSPGMYSETDILLRSVTSFLLFLPWKRPLQKKEVGRGFSGINEYFGHFIDIQIRQHHDIAWPTENQAS